jgi:hypothetical protein
MNNACPNKSVGFSPVMVLGSCNCGNEGSEQVAAGDIRGWALASFRFSISFMINQERGGFFLFLFSGVFLSK